jgi:HEAT repeat protein
MSLQERIAALKAGGAEARRAAVTVILGANSVPEVARPALIETLRDDDAEVRRYAAFGLGLMGPPLGDTISPLVDTLKDPHNSVAIAAAWALGRMGMAAAAAVPALIAEVEDRTPEHVRTVGTAATWALGYMASGAANALPILFVALKDPWVPSRLAAAWTLGRIGSRAAIPALLEALGDEEEVVWEAASKALDAII